MKKEKLTFISKEKVFEMLENEEDFKLVEVLSEEDYKSGHLPKAINLPADQIESKAAEVLPDKEQKIVVYCSGFLCTASSGSARMLQQMGYKNVLDFKGGKEDWEKAGLPLISE